MSLFEKALKVLVNDLGKVAAGWGDRILSNKLGLSHPDYLICNARFHALNEARHLVKMAAERAENNEEAFPETFLSEEKPEEEKEPAPVSANVDISTGDVTHSLGGNS